MGGLTMKKNILALAALMALVFSGCVKEGGMPGHEPGTAILFGASTSYSNVAGTRTEYSGELLNSNTIERINWVPEYDVIRIWSPQAKDLDAVP